MFSNPTEFGESQNILIVDFMHMVIMYLEVFVVRVSCVPACLSLCPAGGGLCCCRTKPARGKDYFVLVSVMVGLVFVFWIMFACFADLLGQ